MPEQCFDIRVASAEGSEGLRRRPAAAHGQDLVAEALSGAPVEHAFGSARFLEGAERVGRKHLGPLVAVVARGIATGEDMREVVRETVVCRRHEHCDLLANLVEHVLRTATTVRVEIEVQVHVEEGELHLPQDLQSRLEVLGRDHLVEKRARQRFSRVYVAGHVF